MAVTIVNSSTVHSWQNRDLQSSSNGYYWTVTRGAYGNGIRLWYSTDDGATWAQASGSIGIGDQFTQASFFIDQDDHAHLVVAYDVVTSGYKGLKYYRMASISSTGSWSAGTTIKAATDTTATWYSALVAHREGTGWKAHIFHTEGAGAAAVSRLSRVGITSGGTITLESGPTTVTFGGAGDHIVGIDFHHTAADPKAIQGATPHLYLAAGNGTSIYLKKYTYSGGTWTGGTVRTLGTSGTNYTTVPKGCMVFDGDRAIVAVNDSAASQTTWWERDAADTTTTSRTAALNSAGPDLGGILYDGDGDVWIVGSYATPGNYPYAREWVRSSNAWQTPLELEAESLGGVGVEFMVPARKIGQLLPVVYSRSNSDVRFDLDGGPVAPTAPTWVSPVDFAGQDVGAALVLDWTFNDPNTGDTQGKYAVRRQIGTGTLYYWRASDSSWQTSETANVSATTSLTLASGWGSDGDANHKYAVKTWDAGYLEGVYGAELTVVPSSPDLPTITTPADASTHVTSSITVEWTVATQTTYLVELLDSAGTSVLATSGTQTSTSVREHAIAYTLLNGVDYKARVTTANDEGLVGTADTNSFSVSYTAPATPTLTVTADTPTGAITVAHANPTPTGTQPTVTSCDMFVRCTTGTYADGERPVAGNGIRVKTGLAPDADWIDYAPASGRAYQYLVRAYGDNGTTGDSAWTA